ncbi:MAG: hypothetical protein EXX96DRAFT_560075 [Benjaminiella poitrasii]|nr:MAG: hypothetical protein EXX96DRAFT_560075 [Benjaminiella poitrasii]
MTTTTTNMSSSLPLKRKGLNPIPSSSSIPLLKKPTRIDALLTTPDHSFLDTTDLKSSYHCTTTSSAINKSVVAVKRFRYKLKKPTVVLKRTNKKHETTTVTNEKEEEEVPMTKPLTITERRKRQAQRATQIKMWKVREEREAREARLKLRRQIVSGGIIPKLTFTNTKQSSSSLDNKKKKRVKFNTDRNRIIQIPATTEDVL